MGIQIPIWFEKQISVIFFIALNYKSMYYGALVGPYANFVSLERSENTCLLCISSKYSCSSVRFCSELCFKPRISVIGKKGWECIPYDTYLSRIQSSIIKIENKHVPCRICPLEYSPPGPCIPKAPPGLYMWCHEFIFSFLTGANLHPHKS